MAKSNRVCHCCGKEYYYCPSCETDNRDPRIFTMWDSEKCRSIFYLLTDESLKKITTKECKRKLIEMGVPSMEVKQESVKKHIQRVMAYEEPTPMAVTNRQKIQRKKKNSEVD